MKLKLPHKIYNLDMELPLDKRREVIDVMFLENVKFHEETMTVEDYLYYTFQKPNTIIILDIIGYYLTKENKNLEVLSNTKQKEMIEGSKRHTTFSGMGYDNQVAVGIIDIDD